jgi:hypothetical protein
VESTTISPGAAGDPENGKNFVWQAAGAALAGIKNVAKATTTATKWQNGLVFHDELQDAAQTLLKQTNVTWEA